MDVPLIIKQVCQQPSLMEVMQRGSGPERWPLGTRGGRGVGGKAGWARTLGGWGAGVDSGLELGRSNNAVKAFLNIVNIPKPAMDEAISQLAAAPSPLQPDPHGSVRFTQQ